MKNNEIVERLLTQYKKYTVNNILNKFKSYSTEQNSEEKSLLLNIINHNATKHINIDIKILIELLKNSDLNKFYDNKTLLICTMEKNTTQKLNIKNNDFIQLIEKTDILTNKKHNKKILNTILQHNKSQNLGFSTEYITTLINRDNINQEDPHTHNTSFEIFLGKNKSQNINLPTETIVKLFIKAHLNKLDNSGRQLLFTAVINNKKENLNIPKDILMKAFRTYNINTKNILGETLFSYIIENNIKNNINLTSEDVLTLVKQHKIKDNDLNTFFNNLNKQIFINDQDLEKILEIIGDPNEKSQYLNEENKKIIKILKNKLYLEKTTLSKSILKKQIKI